MFKGKNHLCRFLFAAAYPSCDFALVFCRHAEHAQHMSDKLIKMFIANFAMCISYAAKFNNCDLTRFGEPKVPTSVKRAQDRREMKKTMHS
jgi:cyclic lactone autoinducer peptide